MRHIFLLTAILFCLSCSRHKSDNGCPEDTYRYKSLANSKIDTQTNNSYVSYNITSGDKLVFQYQHINNICQIPSDGGYTETLVFELPAGSSGFSVSDHDFKNINIWYRMSCFCPKTSDSPIERGTLSGHKSGTGVWHVQGTVTIPGKTQTISINANFPTE